MNHWVMDYETLSNCFVAVFEHFKHTYTKIFVVSPLRNDLQEFLDFLKQNKKNREWHVSFNGLDFDSQITEFFLKEGKRLMKMSAEDVAKETYDKAQDVIARKNRNEFSEYPPWKLSIRQVDVYRLNHWDNVAKRSSLKWIQYSMDWDNIQDMPLDHTASITTEKDLYMVIDYCINDVRSTKEIMNRSKAQIQLRRSLTKSYGIDLYSASETKISKELFLHFLGEKTGIEKKYLKQLRTKRNFIMVKDIILPYLKFRTKEFQDLRENFEMLVIDPNVTKKGFKHKVIYKGVPTDFGLGGVHGATKSGAYESNYGWIIMTSDVASFYPNLAIRNKWAPDHLPKEEFCEQYEWFYDERKLIPKSDPTNYTYKIVLNSTYGLSNDKNSFLYDPEFTMRITVNGQLSLMMLYEMLGEGIPESVPLMQNTDGLEIMIPVEKKDLYLKICSEWESMTKLVLEHDVYQSMYIADVNNYIAVHNYKEVSKEDYEKLKTNEFNLVKEEDGVYYHAKTKCKGRFEFQNLPLHKNKSFLVVRKAIFNFLLRDIPPEKTLEENCNIFDYCGGVKIKGDWEFQKIFTREGEVITEKLQKTLRYYVSKKGCKVIKKHKYDGREIQLESGVWLQTVFNKYEEKDWKDYDINQAYYLEKIYKEIYNICPPQSKQLELF